jgi:translation initiation factor 2 subunit 2
MITDENISGIIEEKELLIDNQEINNSEKDLIDGIFSTKKKKKKNKDKDNDNDNNNDNNNNTENNIILKKEIPQEEQEEQELLDMFDLKLKKHKKNKEKHKEKNKDNSIIKDPLRDSEEYDPPIYTYQNLLQILYSKFTDNNIEIKKSKNSLKLPIVQRLGSKRTGWINFKECCTSIGREEINIINYLISELSTEANIDGKSVLLIKGIYTQKNIENILRKFIVAFVQCSICKSLETVNKRDNNNRINFLECLSCKSTRALQQIITRCKNKNKSVKLDD